MPSGAKKRKAAKKKKEQQASRNNQTNTHCPLGNDDPKSQGERENDGGQAGSPALQDHNQHPFKQDNGELGKSDPAPVRSFDSENNSMEEVAQGLEGSQRVAEQDAVSIGKELNPEKDFGSHNTSICNVEFVKEAHNGSSSNSSSNTESQVVASQIGRNKPTDPSLKVVFQGIEKASIDGAENSAVESALAGHSMSVENEVAKRNDDKQFSSGRENNQSSLTVVETVTNKNEGQTLPRSITPMSETSNDGENERDSKIPDSSESQPFIASAPPVEQRTSWMSCCGLFDVLTSSSR